MVDTKLPLFYRQVTVLEGARHADLKLRGDATYRFAADTNSIPLAASEFAEAARDYPIVFSSGSPIVPVAITGLRQNSNLFVDAEGKWADGVYVPAYARRYPFILVENKAAGKLVLCFDETAGHFANGGEGGPLFEDAKPTELTQNVMNFCTEFQKHYLAAVQLCEVLVAFELLVPRRADVELVSGEKLALDGFQMVDEDRLRSLPDEKFLELRHKGVLPLIYLHLSSSNNWRHLINRVPRDWTIN